MTEKLEIITAKELIEKDFNVPEGTGVLIQNEVKNKLFYLVDKDGFNELFVRKNGEKAEYIQIDLKKSSLYKKMISFGRELHIEEANPEIVNNYLKKIGVVN